MKKVAIVQSNYIPWKGYFDLMAAADEFVIYDDMQYTKRNWRNRNLIKTPQGTQWLTVPVKVKGKYQQKIREVEICGGRRWAETHWRALERNYQRAAHFAEVASWIEPLYRKEHFSLLSELNQRLIKAVCGYLGISTRIRHSWDYDASGEKSERLAEICVQAGAGEYLSGPLARDYLDEGAFVRRQIKVTWFDYDGYPEYPQLWGEFIHQVSILDLLFNCGKDAPRMMRYVR